MGWVKEEEREKKRMVSEEGSMKMTAEMGALYGQEVSPLAPQQRQPSAPKSKGRGKDGPFQALGRGEGVEGR
jgi:hypothetical protein